MKKRLQELYRLFGSVIPPVTLLRIANDLGRCKSDMEAKLYLAGLARLATYLQGSTWATIANEMQPGLHQPLPEDDKAALAIYPVEEGGEDGR